MTITFNEFINNLITNPKLLIISTLILGVILVNGWTDAPNAIATCVATRSLSAKKSLAMAAICNFLGVFIMTLLNATVIQTIYNMVDFGTNAEAALTALTAAMVAIVVWAVLAWFFGIPTSESHALIAGISGSAIAINWGFKGINGGEWMKVIYGIILSCILGFGLGYIISKIIKAICKDIPRQKTTSFFKKTQIGGAAAMAFMHGAQDGQKFMGIFLLGVYLSMGITGTTSFVIPIWLMVLCSAVMTLGTSIGGYKIIKTVGMGIVKMEAYEGTAADISGALSLLFSTIFGLPVSTTHTKSTAIMGVGASKRFSNVKWSTAKNMVYTWILTFPGCGILGFIVTIILLNVL